MAVFMLSAFFSFLFASFLFVSFSSWNISFFAILHILSRKDVYIAVDRAENMLIEDRNWAANRYQIQNTQQ